MRLSFHLGGREVIAIRLEHDDGIKELAAAIGELAQLRPAAVAPAELEEEADDDTPAGAQIGHHVDADVERDLDPHDSTIGWRWDHDASPCPSVPSATEKPGFGFGRREK